MTPGAFIAKWRATELKERSAAQEHFIDLCRLLGEPTPAEADPSGERYCFERGARKDTGGDGWADVWKRHCFAWEYKGRRANLDAAFDQLRQYALALENPPLLIVSDMARFRIRTHWTNSVSETHEFTLDDLAEAAVRDKLKWAMSDPERLRPGESRQALTERAAATFARLAWALRERGHGSQAVAHFVNRLVFCMFAEDVGLLPDRMFTRMLEQARKRPEEFAALARDLFGAMSTGGRIGFEPVAWFNGGLFDDDATALPLEWSEIETALAAAALDWSEIDPSILGTLFERGLDPDKRSQLGAHYTDRDKIMRIVEPVVVRPLLAEWEAAKAGIAADLGRAEAARSKAAGTRQRARAERRLRGFLERLRRFTVLDPACGSGNFLYLALHALKDVEHRAQLEAEAMGLQRAFPAVGPANVRGMELNAYAAELARVSVWIGEIQWMRRHGFRESRDPILKPLDTIECRDALLAPVGGESERGGLEGGEPEGSPLPMKSSTKRRRIVRRPAAGSLRRDCQWSSPVSAPVSAMACDSDPSRIPGPFRPSAGCCANPGLRIHCRSAPGDRRKERNLVTRADRRPEMRVLQIHRHEHVAGDWLSPGCEAPGVSGGFHPGVVDRNLAMSRGLAQAGEELHRDRHLRLLCSTRIIHEGSQKGSAGRRSDSKIMALVQFAIPVQADRRLRCNPITDSGH